MKPYTEDQLKAALVRALPKKLEIQRCIPSGVHYYWIHDFKEGKAYNLVTPHEWPAIVWMVEDMLTLEQRVDYSNRLGKLCGTVMEKIYAKWPTRAQALAEIGVIKV